MDLKFDIPNVQDEEENFEILSYSEDFASAKISSEKRLLSKSGILKNKLKTKGGYSKQEKLHLAEAIREEAVIYNVEHVFHTNHRVVSAAWQRISNKVNKPVSECKVLYKSIRDAIRYRQKKMIEKCDFESGEDELWSKSSNPEDCEFFNAISFLTPNLSFSHNTVTDGSSEDAARSNDSFVQDLTPMELESSRNSPVHAYATRNKEESDIVESSLKKMAEAMSGYMERSNAPKEPTLKYGYIWQYMDNLFQQMSQADVNELNFKFVQLAFEKINAKKSTS